MPQQSTPPTTDTQAFEDIAVSASNTSQQLQDIAIAHRAGEEIEQLPDALKAVVEAKYVRSPGAGNDTLAADLGVTTEEFQTLHDQALRALAYKS